MATTPVIRQTPQDSTPKREALSVRDALYAKVAAYGKLEPNYGGDNERPPEQNDVGNMLSFIDCLSDSAIDSVELMLAGDGEIGFEWKEPGKHYLEIVFSDGEISFFGDMRSTGERLKGTVDYEENAIPEKLQLLLSDIFPG